LKGNNYSDKKVVQPPRQRGGQRWGVRCGEEKYTEGVEGAQNEEENEI